MFNIKEHEIETMCQGTIISVDGGGGHVDTVRFKSHIYITCDS